MTFPPRLWHQEGRVYRPIDGLPDNADSVRNVAVMREGGGIGDAVCTFPVCEALKQRFPRATLWYFCNPYQATVLDGCPAIDRLVVRRHSRAENEPPRFRSHEHLRSPGVRWDLMVDLCCPCRQHEIETVGAPTKSRVQLFAEAAGLPWLLPDGTRWPRYAVTDTASQWAETWFARHRVRADKLVVVQPFANSAWRCWTPAAAEWVARRLLDSGWVPFLDYGAERFSAFPGVIDDLPIWKLAAVLERCRLVVTVDSGQFHLAGAVGAKVLGLFGSTRGELFSCQYPRAVHLQAPVNAGCPRGCMAPCYEVRQRGCRDECRRHGCAVLTGLWPHDVLPRVLELLGDGDAKSA